MYTTRCVEFFIQLYKYILRQYPKKQNMVSEVGFINILKTVRSRNLEFICANCDNGISRNNTTIDAMG